MTPDDELAERAALVRIRQSLNEVAEEVAALPHLWGMGDPGGGHIHHELDLAVARVQQRDGGQ